MRTTEPMRGQQHTQAHVRSLTREQKQKVLIVHFVHPTHMAQLQMGAGETYAAIIHVQTCYLLYCHI